VLQRDPSLLQALPVVVVLLLLLLGLQLGPSLPQALSLLLLLPQPPARQTGMLPCCSQGYCCSLCDPVDCRH
jgi:hypothetical protein